MTNPSDPDPQQTPDLEKGGAVDPQGGAPASDSTSLDSDSAATDSEQAPPPRGQNRWMIGAFVAVGILVLLIIVGLIAMAMGLG